CGRNTAMAVGYAALAVARRAPDATLLVLPADHVIPDARAFAVAARRAARAAHRAGALVTLGVRPTRPETGYGYIQVGAPAGRGPRARLPGARRLAVDRGHLRRACRRHPGRDRATRCGVGSRAGRAAPRAPPRARGPRARLSPSAGPLDRRRGAGAQRPGLD